MTQLSDIIINFFGDYTNGNYSYFEAVALGTQNILAATPTVIQYATEVQDTDSIFNPATGVITTPLSMNNSTAILTSSVFNSSVTLTVQTSSNGTDWTNIYRSNGQVNAILRLQTGLLIRVLGESASPFTVSASSRISLVVLNATLGNGSSTTNVQTGFEQHFLLMGG